MKLFVGLGNPGGKYMNNRHNIGFMAIDHIAEQYHFPNWREKFQGAIAEGMIGHEKVLLLKPMTFMNLSGQSAGEAARFYKIPVEDILVFHDELDLAPSKVKVKSGGGHAGHNGLRSLHQHLGEQYDRVRLGIGHPGDKSRVHAHVLGDFSKADQDWLDPLLTEIAKAAEKLTKRDYPGFLNAIALNKAPALKKTAQKQALPKDKPSEPEADTRSPLQKLMDKFNR